jgi:hypothetical protein
MRQIGRRDTIDHSDLQEWTVVWVAEPDLLTPPDRDRLNTPTVEVEAIGTTVVGHGPASLPGQYRMASRDERVVDGDVAFGYPPDDELRCRPHRSGHTIDPHL